MFAQQNPRTEKIKNTASSVLYFGCSNELGNGDDYKTIAKNPIMIANNEAPSTKAAARIMFARISLEASG